MRIPRRASEKARVEVIPMIDMVFFLLVFFMLSTLSMTINRGLPVNLPKAASSQRNLRETFNITVTKEGEIFLNKESVTLPDLAQRSDHRPARTDHRLPHWPGRSDAVKHRCGDLVEKIPGATAARKEQGRASGERVQNQVAIGIPNHMGCLADRWRNAPWQEPITGRGKRLCQRVCYWESEEIADAHGT